MRDSVKQGCKISHGSPELPKEFKEGNFFEPVVLENIPTNSRAFSEELFGPVFSLYKVGSDQEAIDLANSSVYGLGAAVFTKDLDRAEKMARLIDSGMVYINDFVQSQSDVPSGGCKDSGYGRECFTDCLFDLSNKKSIVI